MYYSSYFRCSLEMCCPIRSVLDLPELWREIFLHEGQTFNFAISSGSGAPTYNLILEYFCRYLKTISQNVRVYIMKIGEDMYIDVKRLVFFYTPFSLKFSHF